MSAPAQSFIRNRLLTALSPESFVGLLPHLETIDLPLKMDLVEPDQPTTHVYFLETGLASIVASSSDGQHVEVGHVGHVGHEGMSGTHVMLGCDRTPNRTFMQAVGMGLRISIPLFREVLEDDAAMHKLFLRYLQSYVVQISHSALANGRYSMHARLARWLLMSQDRVGDDIPLTHESLSLMLGVRRSGVTNEIHVLEGTGVIKAMRGGHLRIIDRHRLEEVAGGAYGLLEREYD